MFEVCCRQLDKETYSESNRMELSSSAKFTIARNTQYCYAIEKNCPYHKDAYRSLEKRKDIIHNDQEINPTTVYHDVLVH